jgi:hypothetical protein
MSTVMIDLMRRQAVLKPAGCPKTEQKFNHTASLGGFGMPGRRILGSLSLRGTPYPMRFAVELLGPCTSISISLFSWQQSIPK